MSRVRVLDALSSCELAVEWLSKSLRALETTEDRSWAVKECVARGWSPTELSLMMGVSRATIYNLKNNGATEVPRGD